MLERKNLASYYIETNLAPFLLDDGYTPCRGAVNSIAIITGQKWKDLVKELVNIAHERGNMPSYRTCITEFFRKNGMKPYQFGGSTLQFLEACNREFSVGRIYIIGNWYGYFVVCPDEESGSYHLKGMRAASRPMRDCRIHEIWQYIPGSDNRTGIKRKTKKSKAPTNQDSLEFTNLNPNQKFTGDCSVRGLAGAYGCTWHEALDYMATATEFSDPQLNTTPNINSALLSLGFTQQKPIKRGKKYLNGKEFCEAMDQRFSQGERIFAYFGKSHCAAVVPIKDESGQTRYKVQDTWDSTTRCISDWFVYKEPVEEPQALPEKSEILESGQTVHHPQFGDGVILSINGSGDSKVLEIDFEKVGIKKILETWLKKLK